MPFKVLTLSYVFKCLFIFERERERERVGEEGRRENPKQALHRQCNTEPDAGLELTNCENMT